MIQTTTARTLPLGMFDPATILTDAATYQFRAGGDANGVTKKRQFNDGKWDALLHGAPLLLHERMDGRLFVADGHHRLDFAKQLNARGEGPGQIAAYVLREADGYSAEDAKIMAAYANMSRGTADVVDSARVFKEAREKRIDADKLPQLQMDKGNLTLSYTLSGLSAAALKRVEKGEVTPEMAEKVATQIPAERQENVMRVISMKLKQSYQTPQQAAWQPKPEQSNDNFEVKRKESPEGFAAKVLRSRELAAALKGMSV